MGVAKKYRKKPVVIEAVQLRRANIEEVGDWISDQSKGEQDVSAQLAGSDAHLVIHTLEGNMRADLGDFVVRGVQGEFYPVKADIFAATYEFLA